MPAKWTDPLHHWPTLLILLALFTAPLTLGFWLQIGWLRQLVLIWLVVFILGLWAAIWRRLQIQEVRDNMRRILEEREKERQEG